MQKNNSTYFDRTHDHSGKEMGAFIGQLPIGGIAWWYKALNTDVELPKNWMECNGQTVTDIRSVYYGSTLPNINGDGRFIRGSATSGTEEADAFQGHEHYIEYVGSATAGYGLVDSANARSSGQKFTTVINQKAGYSIPRVADETRPVNISMVAIIRIF